MLRSFVFLLLAATALPAQPGGTISGVVRNAWSKLPLRRAVVTLSTTSVPPLDAVVYSDTNGAFAFTGVPPAEYYLCSEVRGYQRKCFGSEEQGQPNQPVAVAAGEQKAIYLSMLPLGSVSGTVIGIDGDPVANAQVHLLRPQYERGLLHWRVTFSGNTNDRGEYQLLFVHPGKYKFMATFGNQPIESGSADVTNGQKVVTEMYSTAFYPNAESIVSAATVKLDAGNDLKGIDFTLVPKPQTQIAGKIVVPPGTEGNVQLDLSPVLEGANSLRMGTVRMGSGPPDYQFAFPFVSAGTYRLTAFLNDPGHAARASQIVEAGPNAENLTIEIVKGTPLAGVLTLEGEGGKAAGPYHIRLTPGDDLATESIPETEVDGAGHFHFDEVVPGIWDIGVDPMPPGSYIKSMRYGDQDVLTEEMSLPPGTRQALNITLDMNGTVISGKVSQVDPPAPGAPSGAPAAAPRPAGRTQVLLAPDGKFSNVLSFYQRTVCKPNGEFQFTSVTPGRYKIFAFDHMLPFEFGDPDFLKPYADREVAFEAAPGTRLKHDVTLIVRGPEGAN